jgi:hypothetical protein
LFNLLLKKAGMTTAGSMQHVASSQGGINPNGQSIEALSRLMSIKNGMAGKQQICDLKGAKYLSSILVLLYSLHVKQF